MFAIFESFYNFLRVFKLHCQLIVEDGINWMNLTLKKNCLES